MGCTVTSCTNEHEWVGGKCNHEQPTGPPTDADGNKLQYFPCSQPAFVTLQKLIMSKKWLKSMKFYAKLR